MHNPLSPMSQYSEYDNGGGAMSPSIDTNDIEMTQAGGGNSDYENDEVKRVASPSQPSTFTTPQHQQHQNYSTQAQQSHPTFSLQRIAHSRNNSRTGQKGHRFYNHQSDRYDNRSLRRPPAFADSPAVWNPNGANSPSFSSSPSQNYPHTDAAIAQTNAVLHGDANHKPHSLTLELPRRHVHVHLWLIAYGIPLIILIASTIYGFIKELVFFDPEAKDVSNGWVYAGWILNWASLILHLVLFSFIIAHRTPFSSLVTMGTQIQVTLIALAAISHSNALHAVDVLSPASTAKATVVQLEWLVVFISFVVYLLLLYVTPRRMPIPLMEQLAHRSRAEMMGALRHLQGEIHSLSQVIDTNRLAESVSVHVPMGQSVVADEVTGKSHLVPSPGPTVRDLMGRGGERSMVTNEHGERVMVTTGVGAMLRDDTYDRNVGEDTDLAAAAAAARDKNRYNPSRRQSRRRSLNVTTITASTQVFSTDSRTLRRGPTASDRDIQRVRASESANGITAVVDPPASAGGPNSRTRKPMKTTHKANLALGALGRGSGSHFNHQSYSARAGRENGSRDFGGSGGYATMRPTSNSSLDDTGTQSQI